EEGQLFAQGQTPLRNLFQGPPFAQLFSHISDKRLDQPVWITVRARVNVEGGTGDTSRYGSVTVTDLELGRQRVSSILIYVIMGRSGGGLFRWKVPAVVDSIQIEPGRALIHTRR